MMLKMLQINIGHGREAHDLMMQKATESASDIVLISEPYRKPYSKIWYEDSTNRAAIMVMNRRLYVKEVNEGNPCFVYATVNGVRIYSCYFSPNMHITDFESAINRLELSIRGANGNVLVGGDFNSKSPEWNSGSLDRRGIIVNEMIASLGLTVFNNGDSPTFRRGQSMSIIDITFGSYVFDNQLLNWRVLDEVTLSDHQYITFDITDRRAELRVEAERPKWNVRKLNVDKFSSYIRHVKETRMPNMENNTDKCETVVAVTTKIISKACNVGMPKAKEYKNKRPVYWWTTEIGELRKICLAARRRSTRHPDDTCLKTEYKAKRKALRRAIKRTKREKWLELCEEIDSNPWGKPYQIVTKKFGGRKPIPGIKDPTWAAEIVETLFPLDKEGLNYRPNSISVGQIQPFTAEELGCAIAKLKTGKSPGPDGIPNEAIRLVAELWPELLITTFNKCLMNGVFPTCWKRQKLVLLRKGDKPLEDASSYRPLCMLDTLGKLLECLLLHRLEMEVDNLGGISPSQYGFRKGRSTIDAINEVVTLATAAKDSKGFCAIITLDVKNAFNTVKWGVVRESFRKIGVDKYLQNMIEDYLSNRVLIYETETGIKEYNITAGVPQGSVLGPFLWNVMYDGLLNLELQDGAKLVGYADDVALVITRQRSEVLEIIANDSISRCDRWLRKNGLQLAAAKTEAILITDRRVFKMPKLIVQHEEINLSHSLKYLGVQLDDKLNFHKHVENARDKALKTANTLAKLMPNCRGAKDSTRRLINSVTHSQLIYAAPTFATATKKKYVVDQLRKPQRISALRVISAYRTVSTSAALVLAGIPPVELLIRERDQIYRNSKMENSQLSKAEIRAEARHTIIIDWQNMWSGDDNGRWTFKLIPNIKRWIERKHGNINYFMTQMMTDHGSFNSYLYRFKLKEYKHCDECGAEDDNAEHNLFHCPKWELERQQLNEKLQLILSPNNMVNVMLSSVEAWKWCDSFICTIMKRKCARVPNP